MPTCPHRKASLVVLNVNLDRLGLLDRKHAVKEMSASRYEVRLSSREEQVSHDLEDESHNSLDVTALACEISSDRVECIGSQVDLGYLRDMVGGASAIGAESAKTDGGCLCRQKCRGWILGYRLRRRRQ